MTENWHCYPRVIGLDGRRDGTDEAHKLLVRVHPHPTMPLTLPTRRAQGPAPERGGTDGPRERERERERERKGDEEKMTSSTF